MFRIFAYNSILIERNMKKLLAIAFMLMSFFTMASAQKQAEIKFDKVTIDLGTFPKSNPVRQTVFVFTNTGDAPLVINQAMASCGCTVPTYTKTPIMPGQKGEIKVTYNGSTLFAGHFKKSITVHSNAKTEMTRLYIEGVMTESENK